MANQSALEMLAPEHQIQILTNADTPDDLLALLQASARLHQVYLLNENKVLSTVARRQFHPAVISDALFFAKISQLEQPLSRDTVLALCEIYPSELQERTAIPINMSVALCKLAKNVRFFIDDYARNTLPLVEELGQSMDVGVLPEYWPENPISYSQLSDSEIGRLQRAFCRFEIYRYLFARCSSEIDHDVQKCADVPSVDVEEHASLFLRRFPDFQVTEINCVRDYLYRRLRGIFSRLEDDAVANLPPETFMFDKRGDVEAEEWSSGIWLFCESAKYHHDHHIEHLMSLGLPYIRRIFESAGEEQKDLFIRHIDTAIINHLERDFLTNALVDLGPNPAFTDVPVKTDPPFVYEVNANAELDIPDAWQWAHPQGPPVELSDFCEKGLRDWGYVFWDLGRLREYGILEQDSQDLCQIEFDEYEAADGPSVQRRLCGPPESFGAPVELDYADYEQSPTSPGSDGSSSEAPLTSPRSDGSSSEATPTSLGSNAGSSEASEMYKGPPDFDYVDCEQPPTSPGSDGGNSEASEMYEGLTEIFSTSEV